MDDGYEWEPGPTLRERLGGWWERSFAGWRPDQRSVGVLLAAVFAGTMLAQLLSVDVLVRNLANVLSPSPYGPGPALDMQVNALARLATLLADLLAVAGGVALALRLGWGRTTAILALCLVLAAGLAGNAVFVVTLRPGSGLLRLGLTQFLSLLSPILSLAVVVWSRAPQGEEAG